jgi:dicarboxylate/amino acid:cation (Na+ or H+) symporter, DAACS family
VKWFGDNVAGPVGQIFLRLLTMTVIPLVFTSITLGVARLGKLRTLGRVGARTLGYCLVSTTIAATLGLLLVNLARPGERLDPGVREQLMATYRPQADAMQAGGAARLGIETFVNIFPRNPLQAAANLDLLGVIVFALIFGAALTQLPEEKAQPMLRVFDALGEAITKIIDILMRLAPVGVFGLVFVAASRFGWELLRPLGLYVTVVLLGLLLHAAVVLSSAVRVLGGLKPAVFWSRIRASMATAFATSSSTATLPTNITVAERQLGIPSQIAGIVLPLGLPLCMNGTALFAGVTVLFLAQVFGMTLSFATQMFVLALCVIIAVGTAGVPGGALPFLMVLLGMVGIQPEAIALILGVDRILDMCRTTLNVCGDLTAAVYVARTETDWDPLAVDRPVTVASAA